MVIHAISLTDSSMDTRWRPKAGLELRSRGIPNIVAILEAGIRPSAFPLYGGAAIQREAGRAPRACPGPPKPALDGNEWNA